MSTRLVIDDESQLREVNDADLHYALRLGAKIISYVFHPVFVPVYLALFIATVQPFVVSDLVGEKQTVSIGGKTLLLLRFFLMYSFFPIITVLLAKALGFLDSIYLKTKRDRIIPYVVCMIYYFWMWYVLRNQPQFGPPFVILAFSIFLSSIFGLMANIYIKISMHAIAMGITITLLLFLAFGESGGYGVYISLALLIAGLVCTSRFIVSDHTPKEIYGGLFAGIVAMLIAEGTRGILY